MTHYGTTGGRVGIGGIVGSGGVLVGAGVGGVETDGSGAVGGGVGAGVAAGVTTDAVAVGAAVRASVALGSVAAGPGWVWDGGDAFVGEADGDAVAGTLLGGSSLTVSRVRPNPARTMPTARDGPRRTYRVKEARPAWPKAWPPDFPS